MSKFEKQYLDLLQDVLKNGAEKENRTGINTLYKVGAMIEHDMLEGFPALTTKKVFIRGGVEEQIFFMSGNTNTKKLEEKGINYWKGNTSREFLDKRNLYSLPEGDLGYGYSHQYRKFGGRHTELPYMRQVVPFPIDQLQNAVDLINNDPDSRRIMIELWNPAQLYYMALPPCHHNIQFIADKKRNQLSLLFKMRSTDLFLGLPLNFVMYGFMLESIAKLTNYIPNKLIYFGADAHVYVNHIDAVKEQLTRKESLMQLPKLIIKKNLNSLDDITNLDYNQDIEILNYQPFPAIKADMAV